MKFLVFVLFALMVAGCSSSPPKAPLPPQTSINFGTSFSNFDSLPVTLIAAVSRDPVASSRKYSEQDRMRAVKRILDANFTYKHDFAQYGRGVAWHAPSQVRVVKGRFVGDVKDYCVLARAMLEQAGLPARIAITGRIYDRQFHFIAISNNYAIDKLQLDIRATSYYEIQAVSRNDINKPWELK